MSTPKKKVLFVCLGNSCRSQMAEGFARAYGSDVMEPQSAGLAPAALISPLTIKVMNQRNVDMSHASPKSLYEAPGGPFDLIVNISGYDLPKDIKNPVREWTVQDPISYGEPVYETVAQQLETLVMALIIELRSQQTLAPSSPQVAKPAAGPPTPVGPGGSRMYRRNRETK